MSIEDAIKIVKIVNRYKELEKSACDYQEVISGEIKEFTITTKNGNITIPSEGSDSLGNKILFEIDVLFGEYLDRIEAELKVIDA